MVGLQIIVGHEGPFSWASIFLGLGHPKLVPIAYRMVGLQIIVGHEGPYNSHGQRPATAPYSL
jgi:hypothetical protein